MVLIALLAVGGWVVYAVAALSPSDGDLTGLDTMTFASGPSADPDPLRTGGPAGAMLGQAGRSPTDLLLLRPDDRPLSGEPGGLPPLSSAFATARRIGGFARDAAGFREQVSFWNVPDAGIVALSDHFTRAAAASGFVPTPVGEPNALSPGEVRLLRFVGVARPAGDETGSGSGRAVRGVLTVRLAERSLAPVVRPTDPASPTDAPTSRTGVSVVIALQYPSRADRSTPRP